MTKRITIKTLARDLGVSHMTVSRVLSGNANVNPETRASVLARAEALGYVKSAAARAIRGDAPRIVGLLLPNLVNDFYARFADALADACEAAALQLIIHLTRDDHMLERRSMLRLREVDASAVLMVPAPAMEAIDPALPGGMTVLHLIRQRDGNAALVADDGPAIMAAVQTLIGKGHRRIGFIGANALLSSGRTRLAAFSAAMAQHGIAAEHLSVTGPPSQAHGFDSALELVGRTDPVSALICGGLEISNGALDACLTRGLALPADLAFVGYGDPAHYRWISGGITTIALPIAEMARTAADLLARDSDATDRGYVSSHPAALVWRASA